MVDVSVVNNGYGEIKLFFLIDVQPQLVWPDGLVDHPSRNLAATTPAGDKSHLR